MSRHRKLLRCVWRAGYRRGGILGCVLGFQLGMLARSLIAWWHS